MKLVDLKRPARKVETGLKAADVSSLQSEYPYCTRFTLEKDELKALNLQVSDFDIGETLTVTAQVEVIRLSENESRDSSSKSVEMQIKKIAIDQGDKTARKFVSDYISKRRKRP